MATSLAVAFQRAAGGHAFPGPYSIPGLSFNVEEVEERCTDGSLIDFPGTASEEDETKRAAKLELLQNKKHLMKPLVGNLFVKLLVYHHARSGDPDKRITRRHTSSSANLAIFLRNEVEIYPKMDCHSTRLPWKEIIKTWPDDLYLCVVG